ncbi:hypothetical protein AB5I41_22500 [Sphingomonas sp. MMS24-JH45]
MNTSMIENSPIPAAATAKAAAGERWRAVRVIGSGGRRCRYRGRSLPAAGRR